MDVAELPILGEVAPVELANTAYGVGDEAVDFLAGPSAVAAWLGIVAPPVPSLEVDGGGAGELVELRDAVRSLLEARVDGVRPTQSELDVVERHATAAPVVTRLEWGDRPELVVEPGAPGLCGVLGWLAVGVIELVAGSAGDALARCEAPDCTMLFVRHHGRRRFCHESCSHRTRQARYERRRSTGRDR